MFRPRVILSILASFVISLLFFAVSNKPLLASSLTDTPSTNLFTKTTILATDESFTPRSQTGGNCFPYSFLLRKSQLIPVVSKNIFETSCAVLTEFGVAYEKYIYQNGESMSGEFTALKNHLPIPNSNTIITGTNVSGGQNLRIFKDFNPFGNKIYLPFGQIWYDLPGTSGTEGLITDKSGNALRFAQNTLRASNNGEWAVVYRPGQSLTRIDLSSGAVLPFGDVRGSTAMSISDSGKLAVIYYSNNQTVIAYDLDSCQAVPDRITGAVNCSSVDITNTLASELGNLKNIVSISIFNEGYVSFDAEYTNAQGDNNKATVQVAINQADLEQIDYIAMGDSFASGEGDSDADWYELGTDTSANKCHLSKRSDPYLIANTLNLNEFHSIACSGAVTDDVTSQKQNERVAPQNNLGLWFPGHEIQVNRLKSQEASVITISIGGNDIGFADKLVECVLGPDTCKYAEDGVFRSNSAIEIAVLYETLVKTYSAVASTTNQKTKIFVVAYPIFIQAYEGNCGANVLLNDAEREFIVKANIYLNQVIKSASQEAGVYFLDAEDALKNHNLCSSANDSSMAVNGVTQGNDVGLPWWAGYAIGGAPGAVAASNLRLGKESFHPNQVGHQLLKAKILNLIASNPKSFPVCPSQPQLKVCPGSRNIPLPEEAYWGSNSAQWVKNYNDYLWDISPPAKLTTILSGDPATYQEGTIKLSLDKLAPNTPATVKIFSDPINLGVFSVNVHGLLLETITLPSTAKVGFHTLHVFGQNRDGQSVEYYQHIFIPGPKGDIDDDGILDIFDTCGFVTESNQDIDGDNIDDACDGVIGPAKQASAETPETDKKVDTNQNVLASNSSKPNPTPNTSDHPLSAKINQEIANESIDLAVKPDDTNASKELLDFKSGVETTNEKSSNTTPMIIGAGILILLSFGVVLKKSI